MCCSSISLSRFISLLNFSLSSLLFSIYENKKNIRPNISFTNFFFPPPPKKNNISRLNEGFENLPKNKLLLFSLFLFLASFSRFPLHGVGLQWVSVRCFSFALVILKSLCWYFSAFRVFSLLDCWNWSMAVALDLKLSHQQFCSNWGILCCLK